MLKDRVVVAALAGWLFVGVLAAAPQSGVTWPSKRSLHAMACDQQRGKTVVFGGWDEAVHLGDLWEYQAGFWTRIQVATGPSARSSAYCAYDSLRGVVVLFGGIDASGGLGDTWEWDGIAWQQIATPNAPSARWAGAAFFDVGLGRVVIFGGVNGSSRTNETWTYDGQDWQLATSASSPSPRSNIQMAYDPVLGIGVLHGGYPGFWLLSDTWHWTSTGWVQASPSGPTPGLRSDATLVYDPVSQRVLMFGGNDLTNRFGLTNATWAYDGTSWQQVSSAMKPAPRQHERAVFDVSVGKCLLFGGRMDDTPGGCCNFTGPALDDAWLWTSSGWQAELQPVPGPGGGSTYAKAPVMTWGDADAYAQSVGGHLVSIDSAPEQAWVWQTFGDGRELYMGLTDAAAEGQWVWSSGAALSFTAWAPGEPNGGTAANVGCMSASNSGQWSDCSGTAVENAVIELPVPVTAAATTYGSGCGAPALTLVPISQPVSGSVGTASILNAPTPVGGVAIGFDDVTVAGLPILPLSLASLGMSGCYLLHSNDMFGLPVTSSAAGSLDFSYPIPTSFSLLGQHFYLQAYCFAPGANQLELISSNGIDWLIGNQ